MDLILSTPNGIKEIVDLSIKEAFEQYGPKLLQNHLPARKYEVKEAAKIERCSEQTIYARIKSGQYKAERFGRKYLIPHSELFDDKNIVKSLNYKRNI